MKLYESMYGIYITQKILNYHLLQKPNINKITKYESPKNNKQKNNKNWSLDLFFTVT